MNNAYPTPMRRAWCLPLFALTCAWLLGACASLPEPAHARTQTAEGSPEPAQAQLDNAATYLSLVRQMQGNGMWFASLAHIDALEQRWGASTTTRLLRADALRHTGQVQASAQRYEQLLNGPERAAAFRGLGLLAGAEGDYPRAATLFQSARELLPTDGLLLNDLGYALLMSRQFDAAQLPLMQAAQLVPHHAKVRSNLALYLLTQGQARNAYQVMDEARLSAEARQAIENLARELAPTQHAQLQPSADVGQSGLRMSATLANPPPQRP